MFLFNLPHRLNLVNNCETTNPPAGCPKRSDLPRVRGVVTMKFLGPPNNWKLSDMEDVRIPEIPSCMVHHVSESFIRDMKSRLIQVTNTI